MTGASPSLPPLDDARVEHLERGVFARIRREQDRVRVRRRRLWTGAGAAAAVLVLAVVIAPVVTSNITVGTSGSAGDAVAPAVGEEFAVIPERVDPLEGSAVLEGADTDGAAGREIIASASASVLVDDAAAAAEAVRRDAETRGGYVESENVAGAPEAALQSDEGYGGGSSAVVPPGYGGDAHVVVRVPSVQLHDAVAALHALGEVTSSSVSQQDVTDRSVDLRARIAASEASVQRLTELMAQAGSVTDLVAAESALAERQATLEADRRSLALLEGQVELSSLSVRFDERTETVQADPAGFGDGVATGWNGLMATLNGLVVALGFLLPWLALAALVFAVVWSVRRIRRTPPRTEGDGDA